MTRKATLIKRLYQKPKDFMWDELVTLLTSLGYEQVNQGKTAGFRSRFVHSRGSVITLHKPYSQKILKRYQLDLILENLEEGGFI